MKKALLNTLIASGIFVFGLVLCVSSIIYIEYEMEKVEFPSLLHRVRITYVDHVEDNLYKVNFTSLSGKDSYTINPVSFSRTIPVSDMWLKVRSDRPLRNGDIGKCVLIKEPGLFGVSGEFSFTLEPKPKI